MTKAYDEINPVAAFDGDISGYISTSFVVFRNAKLHGHDGHAANRSIIDRHSVKGRVVGVLYELPRDSSECDWIRGDLRS